MNVEIDGALLAEIKQTLQVGLEMRKRQREYFRIKDHEVLLDAKRLESAFDIRLASLGYR